MRMGTMGYGMIGPGMMMGHRHAVGYSVTPSVWI
jgi:hypothetical protein